MREKICTTFRNFNEMRHLKFFRNYKINFGKQQIDSAYLCVCRRNQHAGELFSLIFYFRIIRNSVYLIEESEYWIYHICLSAWNNYIVFFRFCGNLVFENISNLFLIKCERFCLICHLSVCVEEICS